MLASRVEKVDLQKGTKLGSVGVWGRLFANSNEALGLNRSIFKNCIQVEIAVFFNLELQ